DVAWTLQVGRKPFAHRRIAVCRDRADALAVFEGREPRRLLGGRARAGADVAFLFPRGGTQHAGLGAELYATEPAYPAAFDECRLGFDLRAVSDRELEAPSRALPALFATEYALARLVLSWGIEPAAMIGHSMGEYVAACIAGVLSPQDGMRLVATRGRLFETLPPGGMLIVPLPAPRGGAGGAGAGRRRRRGQRAAAVRRLRAGRGHRAPGGAAGRARGRGAARPHRRRRALLDARADPRRLRALLPGHPVPAAGA